MLKQSLRRVKRSIVFIFRRFLLHVLRQLFLCSPGSRKRISLGYLTHNPKHMDGLGAQLQRVIAVRGLAEFWGLSSWQPKIHKIAIHPLDGFNSAESVSEYLGSVNSLIEGKTIEPSQKILYIENPGFFAILLVYLRTIFSKQHIFLMISLPFTFVDSRPDLYCLGASAYRERLKGNVTIEVVPEVAIHHRWGTGSGIIQPGQNVSRSVSLARFKDVIGQRFGNLPLSSFLIFTDAPSQPLEFIPDKESEDSWKATAGFTSLGIKIRGQAGQEIESWFPSATVVRGGNPLETLANLSTAKTIFLSNSSFGYIAAILSRDSEVFMPKEFWHPPMKNWNTF